MKPVPESWWIHFAYDAVNDVVEANFRDVVLESDEDVFVWRNEVEKRFQRYGRTVDLLINLEGLIVRPSAARSFGVQRSFVLEEYTRCSFRFNGNPQTRTSIYTSAVIHGADANLYDSRMEALKALLAFRKSENLPAHTPLAPSSQRSPSSLRAPVSAAPQTLRAAGVSAAQTFQRNASVSSLPALRPAPQPVPISAPVSAKPNSPRIVQHGPAPLSQRVPALTPPTGAPSTPKVPYGGEPLSQRTPSSKPSIARPDGQSALSSSSSEKTGPLPLVPKK